MIKCQTVDKYTSFGSYLYLIIKIGYSLSHGGSKNWLLLTSCSWQFIKAWLDRTLLFLRNFCWNGNPLPGAVLPCNFINHNQNPPFSTVNGRTGGWGWEKLNFQGWPPSSALYFVQHLMQNKSFIKCIAFSLGKIYNKHFEVNFVASSSSMFLFHTIPIYFSRK